MMFGQQKLKHNDLWCVTFFVFNHQPDGSSQLKGVIAIHENRAIGRWSLRAGSADHLSVLANKMRGVRCANGEQAGTMHRKFHWG